MNKNDKKKQYKEILLVNKYIFNLTHTVDSVASLLLQSWIPV